MKIIGFILVGFISLMLLLGYVKGSSDPSYFQLTKDTALGGPFEASNSTARYALTEAIAINHTFFLTPQLAKFSSPDVVEYKGKFTSIFTPGISFLGVPFFLLGMTFGYPQLASYFLTILLAIANVYLITLLSKKLGTGTTAGLIAGFVFLFASNGLAYSLTFTQHHASACVVLLSLLTAIGKPSIKKMVAFGALLGIGILIDIPNAFFLAPIGIYFLARSISLNTLREKIQFNWQPTVVTILIGLIPFVLLFGWYNLATNGSVTKLGQTIGRSHAFRSTQPRLAVDNGASTIPDISRPIGLSLPFETRAELQGGYILLLSDERSWLYYSPVLLLGILGCLFAYKRKETKTLTILMISIILIDIVLYSMFGDPWGGWAFGPRYLIPAAALMAAFLGVAIERLKKNPVWIIVFTLLLLYSVMVNSLGALTTAAIPPKVEAVNLPSHIPYTYKYNEQLLTKDFSGSLVYNTFLSGKIKEINYYYFLVAETMVVFVALYTLLLMKGTRK